MGVEPGTRWLNLSSVTFGQTWPNWSTIACINCWQSSWFIVNLGRISMRTLGSRSGMFAEAQVGHSTALVKLTADKSNSHKQCPHVSKIGESDWFLSRTKRDFKRHRFHGLGGSGRWGISRERIDVTAPNAADRISFETIVNLQQTQRETENQPFPSIKKAS